MGINKLDEANEIRNELKEIQEKIDDANNDKMNLLKKLEKIENNCKHRWHQTCVFCGRVEPCPLVQDTDLSLELL